MATTCRHCRSKISGKLPCSICDETLINQCRVCHEEVAHGQITNQNIHFVGGRTNKTDRVDDDVDAYRKAEVNS